MFYFWVLIFPTFCQSQECANVGCLIAHGTKFCTVVLDNFTIIAVSALAYKMFHQFTCSDQKVPDNSEVHRSCQRCVFLMELTSCYCSGTKNLEVAPRSLENLWTPSVSERHRPTCHNCVHG
jgi:hypothetical protein